MEDINEKLAKENNKDNGKQNKFYSVNLTEGRIIGILFGFIGVLVIGLFAAFLILNNSSKNKLNSSITDEMPTIIENTNNLNDNLFTANKQPDLSADVLTTKLIETSPSITTTTLLDNTVNLDNGELKASDYKIEDNKTKQISNNTSKVDSKFKQTTVKTSKNPIKEPVKKIVEQDKYKTNVTKKIDPKPLDNKKAADKTALKTTNKLLSKKFVVQVGSYNSKKSAVEVSVFYEKAGYPVYIKEFQTNGKTFYRLRVGPFDDKSYADKCLTFLKSSKYGKESFLSEVIN